jgi:hypothetical protein
MFSSKISKNSKNKFSTFQQHSFLSRGKVWRKFSTLIFGCSLTACFSLVYYFAGARVCRKGITPVFPCTLADFFIWCAILQAPGSEEKAARWLSGAP